ncbi:MAG: hypothetical protein KDD66_11480 [Bdellovibrionales bacterium]|nr:hypothetical protein [Bdellovibrionales bacterium]
MKAEKKQLLIACSLAAVIIVAVFVGLYLPSREDKKSYKVPQSHPSATSTKRIGGSVGEFNLSGPN